MIRYFRELRLIPIALIASACLLALKAADLVLSSSYFAAHYDVASDDGDVSVIHQIPGAGQIPGTISSWARQMFNFPDGSRAAPAPGELPSIAPRLAQSDNADITGSVSTTPADGKAPADAKAGAAPPGNDAKNAPPPTTTVISSETTALPSGAERAILEHLQDRRQELDSRARELDMRESLIQGAEKRIDARLTELKEVEERIKVETQQKSDAEVARLKGLITMYENMKPRDAAKIFNGLDSGVLLEVAAQMNPRQMSEIMAQMAPDVAQHLTVELASEAEQPKASGPDELPKIQGQSATQ